MRIQEISAVSDVDKIWDCLSKKQKSRINKGSPVSIGQQSHEGWNGSLEHFIIRCPGCKGLFIDCRHGFEGNQYFHCPHCQTGIDC